ncbi:hypothetical protein F4808DRAFT_71485 [Astrocystis sublimbata]|nr:hypothetical protein F4808DRAFT_71485 [Astrocystis sublimbata]
MAEEEQVSFTSLVFIVVLGGLAIRYLFFTSSTAPGAPRTRDAAASTRAREAAVERIQQMFPQLDRRTVLWELQRNSGNVAATTERILAGNLNAPPTSFQPPPPPPSATPPSSTPQPAKATSRPAEPDLITRYKLHDRLNNDTGSSSSAEGVETRGKKAWSNNREERQSALQRRRDDMILAARRNMEAKIAAEKATASGSGSA